MRRKIDIASSSFNNLKQGIPVNGKIYQKIFLKLLLVMGLLIDHFRRLLRVTFVFFVRASCSL